MVKKPLFTDYLQASSIATAQATVIPTIGLLPAPPTRKTRGYYEKSPLRTSIFQVLMCFACAFVDTMWTNFRPHLYARD
mgnify:CR=1 FL=1